MMEEYVEKAWALLQTCKSINPHVVARKFKLNLAFAQRVCEAVWLRQHKEARAAASLLENDGFPSQLQATANRKNLEKFKGKKTK